MTRQRENRKDKIIGVAISYLKRSGIKGTRMEALAREAGISKKTLYQLFEKKEGLLKEAVDAEFRHILRDLKIIAGIRRMSAKDKVVGSLLVISRRAFEGSYEVHQELPKHPVYGVRFRAGLQQIIDYLTETYFSDDRSQSHTLLKSLFSFLTKCAANQVKGVSEVQFREQVIPFYLEGWSHGWKHEKDFIQQTKVDSIAT